MRNVPMTSTRPSMTCPIFAAICLFVAAHAARAADNLASWGAGALLVETPAEHHSSWSAQYLLDDDPSTGWAAPEATPGPHVAVIELAAPARIAALAFDTAQVDTEGSAVHMLRAELAPTIDGPWTELGSFDLADRKDAQRFVVPDTTGRYLRLHLLSNHGHALWTELMGVAVEGRFTGDVTRPSITGAFDTEQFGVFRLQQDGVAAAGCYEHDGGLIENGGFDGRVLRFVWTETNGTERVEQQGSALMVFDDAGDRFRGYWWEGDAEGRPAGFWNGRRTAAAPGTCPHWRPGDNGVAKALEGEGRARLYGILFDTDSATIREDSKPTLDALVAAARNNPGWTLRIEGHTDASGGAAHNRALSLRRADAVKTHLAAAGIDADRLATQGFGPDAPVADNATTAGRSQNRRVEIVRTAVAD